MYGDVDVDGTHSPWEYKDAWARRRDSASSASNVFDVAEWEVAAVDCSDHATDNAGSACPYPASADRGQDIVTLAQSVDALSTLVTAVIAGGLVPTLQSPGPFTVFAPTNDAFAALGQSTINALLADHDRLVDVLTYHVLPVEVHSTDLSDGQRATTVEGGDLTVRIQRGTVSIVGAGSTARVVQADVQASNGVVHVIDTVLLPPTGGRGR